MLIQILNGLVYGTFLFAMASGLALMFGLRRIVNFAHGALYMLGAYLGYSVASKFGFWWGLLAAAIILAIIGAILDFLVFRPLLNRDPLIILLVTFGLALISEDLVRAIWTDDTLSQPGPAIFEGVIKLPGGDFPVYRIAIIGFGAVIAVGLASWLRTTRVGLYVRASSHNPTIAAVQGINTDRLSALVVAVGAALAGMSGMVAAPILSLTPSMGGDILIDSFVVVVIGGLGSIVGAFVAAMILGQLNVFSVAYAPEFTALLPFLLMILVLIWKPTGLAGSRV